MTFDLSIIRGFYDWWGRVVTNHQSVFSIVGPRMIGSRQIFFCLTVDDICPVLQKQNFQFLNVRNKKKMFQRKFQTFCSNELVFNYTSSKLVFNEDYILFINLSDLTNFWLLNFPRIQLIDSVNLSFWSNQIHGWCVVVVLIQRSRKFRICFQYFLFQKPIVSNPGSAS